MRVVRGGVLTPGLKPFTQSNVIPALSRDLAKNAAIVGIGMSDSNPLNV